ncbi:MAG: hypothetical protein [Bacteriophage sp.]|nr:MAG: hypothetical protein [Bacteriophage sp.]
MKAEVKTKGFDINKHKHFSTPLEYISEIYDNKYHFTIQMISEILDFKEQYIQINFIDSLDTLYIDKYNKFNIRGILKDFKSADYLIPKEYREAVEDLSFRRNILNKRVLIRQKSVLELILKTFKKEVIDPEHGAILVDIDENDLRLILKHKLKSTRSAKELLGCNYDTQLYRKLATTRHIKYIVPDQSGKNNTARYLFY